MAQSFFRDIEPRPIEDDDHLPPFESPAWTGPPWHYGYRPVLLDVELGRSDTTVVSLGVVRCYAEGMALELVVRIRESGRQARHRVFSYLERAHGRGQMDGRFLPGGLRWGVEYDDGTRVTTQDESPWADLVGSVEDAVVDGPVLEGLARPSVDSDSWSRFHWIWPTPPAPRMRVGLEWTERGIPEVVTAVDVGAIVRAGERSGPLWDTATDSR